MIADSQQLGCRPRPGGFQDSVFLSQELHSPTALPSPPSGHAVCCHFQGVAWLGTGGNLQTQFATFFVVAGREVKLGEKPNGQSPQQVSYFLFFFMLWEKGLFFTFSIKFSTTQSFTTVFITRNIKASKPSNP